MIVSKIKFDKIIICTYIVAAIVVFITFIIEYLNYGSQLRWSADSLIYIELYQNSGIGRQLIFISQNLLGPLLILYITDGNSGVILLINILLLLLSIYFIELNYKLNKLIYVCLLLVNPIIFLSLLTINKEIILLFVTSIYLSYLESNNRIYLLASLLIAPFVRWQMLLVLIVYSILNGLKLFSKSKRYLVIFVAVGVSLVYPFLSSDLGNVISDEVLQRQLESSGGYLNNINDIQNYFGGYLLVVIPKIIANWFGNIPRIFSIITDIGTHDVSDIYNTFALPTHQFLMFILFVGLLIKKRMSLCSNTIAFAIFYSIIFAISSFIQYRYFLPVYICFIIEISRKYERTFRNKGKLAQ